MWSTYSLNATFIILFVGLIAMAYFSQTETDHPELASIRLMATHHVKLTPEDELDISEMRSMAPVRLPPAVDLYSRRGSSKIPVDNQGQWGSCTAHALRYAWNLLKMRQNPNAPLIVPSRCFWYAESRKRLGDKAPLGDYGSTNEASIWALQNKGSLPESAYPYTSENMTRDPPSLVLSGGAVNRLGGATRFRFRVNTAQNITAMQQALANGTSVIVAVMVYKSFMTSAVMRTGIIPMPNVNRETLVGGHAICLTGYNSNYFTFRNSWGDKVGVRGSFQIPKAYIGNWNLTGDAWIL